MALPSSGSISLNQVNVELGKSGATAIAMNNADVRSLAGKASGAISMSDLRGKSSTITKTITASVNNIAMQSYFTEAEWSSDTDKELAINSGVIVGSTAVGTAALRTGTGGGGKLTIINNGSIRGASGAANSGAAGNALQVQQSVTIENNGDIRGGGGGGGKGGAGGAGSTSSTVREPTSGTTNTAKKYQWVYSFDDDSFTDSLTIYWNGTVVYAVGGVNGLDYPTVVDGYSYYNAAENAYSTGGVYRTGTTKTATSGGAGGNGGRGQGSNASSAAGSAGASGGTSAGKGGTGGTGGGWGAAGSKGGTGAAGNAGSGAAGSNGGAAGRAVLISAGTVTWTATGTRSGAYS